ncbi:RDD family protein [Halobacillus salinarum]|uniref:RDD family protein n=1 Tax=Halobacillus salinarum TaxID=2932257 RepID=A0ABY4EEH2_9BACI|nr:RDD family protein [Halobacillus salinarum]UOQ42862.1 RDD family protein [Halobacillus salinarum]
MEAGIDKAHSGIRLLADILDISGFCALFFLISMINGSEYPILYPFGWAVQIGYLLYSIILPSIWTGYILGKRIFRIKIEKANGKAVTFFDMFIRECIGKFIFGYLSFGMTTVISGLMITFRKDRRAIHDFLAGTMVNNDWNIK